MENNFDESFFFFYHSYNKLTCDFRHSDSHTQICETENQIKYKVHGFQIGVNKRSIMSKY